VTRTQLSSVHGNPRASSVAARLVSLALATGLLVTSAACSSSGVLPGGSQSGAGGAPTASVGSSDSASTNAGDAVSASSGDAASSSSGGPKGDGGPGNHPPAWNDWVWGLVNAGDATHDARMTQANQDGAGLGYRYVYVNNGPDKTTNQLTSLFRPAENVDYVKDSAAVGGAHPGFVIYMLQEDGLFAALQKNVNDVDFMKKYFDSVRTVAEKANGARAIFVVEPDTWGYTQQMGGAPPDQFPAQVTTLGYDWLAADQGFKNDLASVAQGIIATIRKFAPDAYVGQMINLWGSNATVMWSPAQLDVAAANTVTFMSTLYGAKDRGDFIAFEKNGASAGFWKTLGNEDFYWTDEQNGKWLTWAKAVAKGVGLPALGWQISIGHEGTPNVLGSYEDTFMPYFFSHVQDFVDAGFIGILAGSGGQGGTDYEWPASSAADGGWFVKQLIEFDKHRPYL
jgi:hypothetical protein